MLCFSVLFAENFKCHKQITQTAYKTAKINITCEHAGNKSNPKLFCKDDGSVCMDMLSTNSSPKSNGRFRLTDSDSGFNVSISDVSLEDAGVYWCGVKSDSHTAPRKIKLVVESKSFTCKGLIVV